MSDALAKSSCANNDPRVWKRGGGQIPGPGREGGETCMAFMPGKDKIKSCWVQYPIHPQAGDGDAVTIFYLLFLSSLLFPISAAAVAAVGADDV